MTVTDGSALHWPDIARQWAQVGSPLRPAPEDSSFYTKTMERWTRTSPLPPRALIMGVTQEIYHLPWPRGTHLVALDHTHGMINAVWPGPRNMALCGDWTDIPLATGSRDIAFCDGGISVLKYPEETRRMIASLERVLALGGICGLRLYVPPEKKEAPQAVLGDLLARRIANLNVLKLRLGMSIQKDACEGVQLQDVWNHLRAAAPDFEALAAQIGWRLEHLMAINTYRDSRVRYYFPTMAQVLELFKERNGKFHVVEIHQSKYVLGERCPALALLRN